MLALMLTLMLALMLAYRPTGLSLSLSLSLPPPAPRTTLSRINKTLLSGSLPMAELDTATLALCLLFYLLFTTILFAGSISITSIPFCSSDLFREFSNLLPYPSVSLSLSLSAPLPKQRTKKIQ
jgi:hypothetical protein